MTPGQDIVVYPNDAGVPIILGRGEMPKKMTTLQTFWSMFMKPDTLALMQYIDARFDGQIVVKKIAQHAGQQQLQQQPPAGGRLDTPKTHAHL